MFKLFLNKARWLALLSIGFALTSDHAAAQCSIAGPTQGCQGENLQFSPPAGSTNWSWDFGNGKKSNQNPGTMAFDSARTYTVQLISTLANGQPCTTQVQVVIKPKPKLKLTLTSPRVQCYKGNKFCFVDESEGGDGSGLSELTIIFPDATFFHFTSFSGPTSFCYEYKGGTTTRQTLKLNYRVVDANGCVLEGIWHDSLVVKGNMGLDITSSAPRGCDSTTAIFTNNSKIDINDIKTWIWDYGDGQRDTNKFWKPGPVHKYKTHGVFNITLTVISKDSCTDMVTFNAAATNVVIKPKIVPDKDSTCFSSSTVNFTLLDVPALTFNPDSIIWDFGDPPSGQRNNDYQKYGSSHDFTGLGPYYVTVTIKQSPCRVIIKDTVWIMGPQSKIEDPQQGIIIAAHERYQCVITDTVHFTNVSTFYHNDVDWSDDDNNPPGRFRDNAMRLWSFGDNYAPTCTTWTAKGQNVGKNCNFSRDSLPKHWYTPWNIILYDTFVAQNRPLTTTLFNPVTQLCNVVQVFYNNDSLLYKKLFYQDIVQCFTVSLYHKDMVRPAPFDCEHSDRVQLALGPPKAKGLSYEGIKCYAGSSPPYGITFKLDDTKPGCTQEWVAFNFDSLSNPGVFIPQTGLFPPPLPGILPWPPTPPYPNRFVKPYAAGDIADRKRGWATVGLVVGQGLQQAQLKGNPALACYDTVWYHNFLRYLFMDARFQIVKPAVEPYRICRGDSIYAVVLNPIQDSNVLVQWSWGDGHTHLEFPKRYKPHPTMPGKLLNYILKYDIYIDPVSGQIDTIGTDSLATAIIHTWDTVANVSRAQEALASAFKNLGLDMNDISPADIPKYFKNPSGTKGCIDTTGFGSLISFGIQPDSVTIMHKRDSMVADTVWHKYSLEHFHDEHHPLYNIGRFTIVHTLVNSEGCQAFIPQEINVGYYQELFPTINGVIDSIACKGTPITFVDSLRYFAYRDDTQYLDPNAYWRDNNRIQANKETIKWDMDTADRTSQYNYSGPLYSHYYTLPGKYVVGMATKDSLGCRDTIYRRIYISGVKAGFVPTLPQPDCESILTFSDTSRVFDPCSPTLNHPCDSIIFREWDFGDGTQVSPGPSNLKFVGHRYTSKDTFYVKLRIKTQLGCEDSAVYMLVLRGPKPRFSTISDTVICKGSYVTFNNESRNKTSTSEWDWDFGDLTYHTTADTAVTHQYNTPGVYQVYLRMTDFLPDDPNIRCTLTYPDTIGKVPPPVITVRVIDRSPAVAVASDSLICPGHTITFSSALSDPKYTYYQWEFGDGDTVTTNQTQTTHSYGIPGIYRIVLKPGYPASGNDPICPDTDTISVRVVDVLADFDIDNSNMPEAKFTNKSQGATSYEWYFTSAKGEDSLTYFEVQSTAENPGYNYVDQLGDFFVCLIAKKEPQGCADTVCKLINNSVVTGMRPYNVFTPDGNGKNDVFDIDIEGEVKYELVIYNRWGEKVFESTSSQTDWNGKAFNTGADCPAGTYFYLLKYKLKGRDENEVNGTVNLLREP